MNYEPNTIQWRRGDIVIHDADAKEPKMLMRIVGFTRDGLAKCQYVWKLKPRKLYTNRLAVLHNPRLFKLNPDWGNHTQVLISTYQDEWLRVKRWNLYYKPGQRVRVTSRDGVFETKAISEASQTDNGFAYICLGDGYGLWMLEFVEVIKPEEAK